MLFADQIVPPAQLSFVQNVELWAKDQLYGTNDCAMTTDQLLAQMLLMIGVTNPTCGATEAQIQCFLSLLSKSPCQ